jgi:hypothetical protein
MESENSDFPLIFYLGIFLIVLATVIYAINSLESRKNKISPSKIIPTLVPQNESATKSADLVYCEQARLKFNFSYPKDWSIEEGEDFIMVISPDYLISEGYPILEKGASITISVREDIEQDPLAEKIGQNFTDIEIAGTKGIQYDYSYEGTIATNVDLIKDGKLYSIKYSYPSEEQKSLYEETFLGVLESFKFL